MVTLSSNAVQWPGVAVIFYRTENSNPAVGHPPNTDVLCVQQTELALTPNIANLIHPLRLSRLSVHPGWLRSVVRVNEGCKGVPFDLYLDFSHCAMTQSNRRFFMLNTVRLLGTWWQGWVSGWMNERGEEWTFVLGGKWGWYFMDRPFIIQFPNCRCASIVLQVNCKCLTGIAL